MALTLLFIFFAQIVYVSTVTVRWILLVKGARHLAAAISFFEIIVYVYTLGLVVTRLDDFLSVVVYAFGYAVGCLVGTWLEARLAYGTAALQVITPEPSRLAEELRRQGFAGTEWAGHGRDAGRKLVLVVLRRKHLRTLLDLVEQHEPGAVVLELEPRSVRGGFVPDRPWPKVA